MVRLIQNSFHGGQLDFEMMGRQDYQRYAKGATLLRNFNIVKKGGLDKRHGFDRLLDLKTAGFDVNAKVRAIPFAYKKSQGFVLLMSASRCIVVGTAPTYKFKYYDVSGLDRVYDSDSIQELDYQQCGDVLFLAQQDHPPAKITHYLDEDTGEHGFAYEVLDFSSDKKKGIPSITSCKVNRMQVADEYKSANEGQAAPFVEHYKVTAVFNGIETFPCSDFSNANHGKFVTKSEKETAGYWGSTWTGTAYPRPWTESQVLSLTISPSARVSSDGEYSYPEEVRVYRKAFNYFGLVGTVDVPKPAATYPAFKAQTLPTMTVEELDGTSVSAIATNSEYSIVDHGIGQIGYVIENGSDILLSFRTNASADNREYIEVEVGVGLCVATEESDDGREITFTYATCFNSEPKAMRLTAALVGTGTTAAKKDVVVASRTESVSCKYVSKTVVQQDDEGDEEFEARWKSAYEDFKLTLPSYETIKFYFTVSTDSYYLRLSVADNDLAITSAVGRVRSTQMGNVTFDDNYITPDSSITPPEQDEDNPLFEGVGNYPASVALSQQRLIWASTKNDPARVWASEVGDFYNYCNHEIQVTSDPIDFKLPVTRFAKINHICEMRKLLMFNSACEWLIDSSSSNSGLTYETIQAYPQSYSGSSERLKPIICNNSLIFCERTGQSVRRFAYDISNDGFAGRDVSIVSASIFDSNNIVDWTYQQFPFSTLWCILNDGSMASFEYMEEQDIMAWGTHRLGGGGKVVCVATSHSVSPALDMVMDVDSYENATHEEIFAVVRRQGSLWLERMRVRNMTLKGDEADVTDSIYHSLCLDGLRVLTENDPVPTEEVGAVWIPADTTDGATISKEEAVKKIAAGVDVYEGFPFDAKYTSVYPFFQGGIGNGQFDVKHIQGIGLRLAPSYGGKVTPVGAKDSEPLCYYYNDPENDHRPVFKDGKMQMFCHDTPIMAVPGVNTRDGRVTIEQDDPFPFSLLSYEIDFENES